MAKKYCNVRVKKWKVGVFIDDLGRLVLEIEHPNGVVPDGVSPLGRFRYSTDEIEARFVEGKLASILDTGHTEDNAQ